MEKKDIFYFQNPRGLARMTRISDWLKSRVANKVHAIEKQSQGWEACSFKNLDSSEKLVAYCREVLSTYFGYNHKLPPDKGTKRYNIIANKISTNPSWEGLFKKLMIAGVFIRVGEEKTKKNITFETFFPGMYELLWEVFEPFREDLTLSAGGKYATKERCIHVGRILVKKHFGLEIHEISLARLKGMNWGSFFIAQNARGLMHVIGDKEAALFKNMHSYMSQVFSPHGEVSNFYLSKDCRKKIDITDRVSQIASAVEINFGFSYQQLPPRGSKQYCDIREGILSVETIYSFCEICKIPGKIERNFSVSGLRDVIQYCCYYFVSPDEWALMIRGDQQNRDFRVKRGKTILKKIFNGKNKDEIYKIVSDITAWQMTLSKWGFGGLVVLSTKSEQLFCDIYDYLECIFEGLVPVGFFAQKRRLNWRNRENALSNVKSSLSSEYGINFENVPEKNHSDYVKVLHFLGSISLPELLNKIGCSGVQYGENQLFRNRAALLAGVFEDYGLKQFHFSRFGKMLMRRADNNFGEKISLQPEESRALDVFFENGDAGQLFGTLKLGDTIKSYQRNIVGPAYEKFRENMESIRNNGEYHSPGNIFRAALTYSSVMQVFLLLRAGNKNMSYDVLIDGGQEGSIRGINQPDDFCIESILNLLTNDERTAVKRALENGEELTPDIIEKVRGLMSL